MTSCGNCGTPAFDGTANCAKCGAPINTAASSSAAPPPPPPPAAAPQPPPYSAAQPPYTPPPGQYPPPPYPMPPAGVGMQENVASFLCYVLGWLTGIIFILIDKRPAVRFHAAQSIVVFGALHIVRIVLTAFWFSSHFVGTWMVHGAISSVLSILTLVAWIGLMVTAYQGKTIEIPIASGIARSIAGQ